MPQDAGTDAGTAGGVLRRAVRGRRRDLAVSSLLVAGHQVSGAAAADRIVVLDKGRIVESGPHDELVAAGGRYAALWAAWESPRSAVPET